MMDFAHRAASANRTADEAASHLNVAQERMRADVEVALARWADPRAARFNAEAFVPMQSTDDRTVRSIRDIALRQSELTSRLSRQAEDITACHVLIRQMDDDMMRAEAILAECDEMFVGADDEARLAEQCLDIVEDRLSRLGSVPI